jgi:hypothetical protein
MDDLEEVSNLFKIELKANQFGNNTQLTPLSEDKLTSEGIKALKFAEAKIGEWIFLNIPKLRHFLIRHLSWTINDKHMREEKIMDLIEDMRNGDQAKVKAVAQIMIRVSEYPRDKFNQIADTKDEFMKWYDSQNLRLDENLQFQLQDSRLNELANEVMTNLMMYLEDQHPLWVVTAKILTELLKIITNVAIINSFHKEMKKTLELVKNNCLVITKAYRQNSSNKIDAKSENKSSKSTKEVTLEHVSELQIKSPISLDKSLNLSCQGLKKGKQDLHWQNHKQNFLELANSLGFNEPENLRILLREVYTNPMVYLGPPKNLEEDRTFTSRPLVVSRISWKERKWRNKHYKDKTNPIDHIKGRKLFEEPKNKINPENP